MGGTSFHFLCLGPHERVIQCRQGVVIGGVAKHFGRLALIPFALIRQACQVQHVRILLIRLAHVSERPIVLLFFQGDQTSQLMRQASLRIVLLGGGSLHEASARCLAPARSFDFTATRPRL